MTFGFYEILNLLGAVAFFIYGMKIMSDGIQKVAGDRLRTILEAMTSNRFTGVFTGFLTTSIVQSSSATTVMLVSFVNAGLLNLRQAIGVIMGANIGTTMTAWIIAFLGFKFKLSELSLPMLALGVPLLFFRREQTRAAGEFLIGFGLLFLGLSELKNAVEVLNLEQNQSFISFINGLADNSLSSTLLFVLIGTILTIVVQSSSAAMALTLTFIGEGLPFELAAAIVLGENIGTTITANLAAIIGNANAKRAARSHLLFNIIGVIWMLFIFTPFLDFIHAIFAKMSASLSEIPSDSAETDRYSLALFHTVFNIINTLILIWFVKYIEKASIAMVKPDKFEEKNNYKLDFIGQELISSPEAAFLETKKEIYKFAGIIRDMNTNIKKLVNETEDKNFKNLMHKIGTMEELTDSMEEEIAEFLIRVAQSSMTKNASKKVKGLQNVVSDLERMGDIYYRMSLLLEKKKESKQWFIQKQRTNLNDLLDMLDKSILILLENIDKSPNLINLDKAKEMETAINEKRNEVLDQHVESMEKGEYKLKSGLFYKDLFSSCEKLADYMINISVILKNQT
jgi:phosphate:Na+ symporter